MKNIRFILTGMIRLVFAVYAQDDEIEECVSFIYEDME
jgi:hypothetical protein